VHDTVHVVVPEYVADQLPVPGAAHHQRCLGYSAGITGGEIVQHDDVHTVGHHGAHHMRTDVSGPTRHQPRHGASVVGHRYRPTDYSGGVKVKRLAGRGADVTGPRRGDAGPR